MRSTERSVRFSIICAIISARISCSVKFFDAMRMTLILFVLFISKDPAVCEDQGEKLIKMGIKRKRGMKIMESFKAKRNRWDQCLFRLGSQTFSMKPSTKSTSKASSAAGIAPRKISRVLERARPRLINSPKPPAPINAARVAIPTPATEAVRMPAIITGIPRGILISRIFCHSVMPIPRAASMISGGIP